jgi:hypothetical protein
MINFRFITLLYNAAIWNGVIKSSSQTKRFKQAGMVVKGGKVGEVASHPPSSSLLLYSRYSP